MAFLLIITVEDEKSLCSSLSSVINFFLLCEGKPLGRRLPETKVSSHLRDVTLTMFRKLFPSRLPFLFSPNAENGGEKLLISSKPNNSKASSERKG